MKKLTNRSLLTQAVLASSFFVSPLAFATTFGPGTVGPIATSAQPDNIVEVLPTGQITGTATDAVRLDSAGGLVQVDAPNTFVGEDAILATGAGAIGVNVFGAGTNGFINVLGPVAGIHADATALDAILVNATGLTVNNSGTIQSDNFSALHFTALGTNPTINNNSTGILNNDVTGTTAVVLVDAGGGGLVLNNDGTINQQAAAGANLDTILLNGQFTAINNNSGGLIEQTSGAADTGNGINVNFAGATGTITNNQGGTILVTGAGHGVLINADTAVNLINSGVINQTGTGSGVVLNGNLNTFTNNSTGVIEATAPANGATIFNLKAGTTIANGFSNSGNIINFTPGGNAIDFQTNLTKAGFTQLAGTVQGNVLLAGTDQLGGKNVFNMSGGNIAGSVSGAAVQGNTLVVSGGSISGNLLGNGGAGQNLFTLSGGSIGGVVLAGANGDTINLSGTATNQIVGGAGGDTFNLTGGSFNALIGQGGADTINVNATFNQTGTVTNVPTINVNNAGTFFTNNNTITGMSNLLTVNDGTTLLLNNLIQGSGSVLVTSDGTFMVNNNGTLDLSPGIGTMTNNGTLNLGSNGVFNLIGAAQPGLYTGNAGSTILEHIAGTSAGTMRVTSSAPGAVNLLAGSFIQPVISGFVPDNTTYLLASVAGGGTIVDASTHLQPQSATVFFTYTNTPTTISLTSHRNTFTSLSGSGSTQGVAGALDFLTLGGGPTNPTFITLLSLLDQLPDQGAVEDALQGLTPPANYGLVAGSHMGMGIVFDAAKGHMEDIKAGRNRPRGARQRVASNEAQFNVAQNGFNFGDNPGGAFGFWGAVIGGHLDQDERDGLEGYNADAIGGALGLDWGVNDCVTLGIIGSYTHVDVDDKESSPKDVSIKSWQGTLYGQFEFAHGIYLDASVGLASNDYDLNRSINIPVGILGFNAVGAPIFGGISTAAQADFDGTQWGLQGDLGWAAVNNDDYYFSPFARLKYVHLDLDSYDEEGAGDLSLHVDSQDIHEFMGGLGFKLGTIIENGRCMWVPELTAMIGYDFDVDAEQAVATFFGGGPAFETNGVEPGRTIFNLGLGLTGHVAGNSMIQFKYNLELRDDFVSNTGMVQLKYLWS